MHVVHHSSIAGEWWRTSLCWSIGWCQGSRKACPGSCSRACSITHEDEGSTVDLIATRIIVPSRHRSLPRLSCTAPLSKSRNPLDATHLSCSLCVSLCFFFLYFRFSLPINVFLKLLPCSWKL